MKYRLQTYPRLLRSGQGRTKAGTAVAFVAIGRWNIMFAR